jgi:hypothetical protein
MSVEKFIDDLLSRSIYSFSLAELTVAVAKTSIAIKRELIRLVRAKRVVSLRRGFYIIMPPTYRRFGMLPIRLYVDNLFKHLDRPYYVGFYSASQIHGAGHQKVMSDFVMSNKPLRDIKIPEARINFFSTTIWPQANLLDRKSEAGKYTISDPVLTAVDLINAQNKMGGLNRLLANIAELSEEMTTNQLSELLDWYPNKSTLQRFGFLLDEVGGDPSITDLLQLHLMEGTLNPRLLVPNLLEHATYQSNRWRIDQNIKLDIDL